MRATFQMLDELATGWATLAVDRVIVSAIVVAVVAMVGLLLRRRASAHLLSWLWLLPLIPLVAPVENLMPQVIERGGPRDMIAEAVHELDTGAHEPSVPMLDAVTADRIWALESEAEAEAPQGHTSASSEQLSGVRSVEAPGPGALSILMSLWALVSLGLLSRLLLVNVRVRRSVLACPGLEGHPASALLTELLPIAGVRVPVRLAVSDQLLSPATWGWRRPVILIPATLLTRLSTDQLRWVLLHELAHIRRGDLLTGNLQRLVQILWWFHPLVWVVNGVVEQHRECACDDAASSRCDTRSRRRCAEAFFEVVATASRIPDPVPAMASLMHHRTFLRKRLMRLLDTNRRVKAGISPAACLLILVCAAASLALAQPGTYSETPSNHQEARAIVDRAVTWLVNNQEEDGRWTVAGENGKKWAGMESETSTTALAVLSLIEAEKKAGKDRMRKDAGEAIARGSAWLEGRQGPEGAIGPRSVPVWTYGHAMATLALCAVQKKAPTNDRHERIARAAAFIQKIQNPYQGWRYGARDGDNDSKMTSLMMLALTRARGLEIEIPERTFEWGFNWLTAMTDGATGRVGWLRKGKGPGRLLEARKSHPAEKSEEVTAIAAVMQRALERNPAEDVLLRKGMSLVINLVPEWDQAKGSIDYSYWYWGARLLADVRGDRSAEWKSALQKALVANAGAKTDTGSTWPLVDAWSLKGLDVYATATCLRALCATL